ncbi:MAG: hypothetical protein RLZZ15_764 [Verrucomicrobiota bacterium]|jgi:protein involved in polysaccharide export with SLBB domain
MNFAPLRSAVSVGLFLLVLAAPTALPAADSPAPETSAGEVSISGAIKQAGRFSLRADPPMTIKDLILRAGGFPDEADAVVRLTRFSAGEPPHVIYLDCRTLLGGKHPDMLFPLQAGDKIYVPNKNQREPDALIARCGEVLILGHVRQPGRYPLPCDGTMTLVDLILRAGGLRETANTDRNTFIMHLSRRHPNGPATVKVVETEGLLRGLSKYPDARIILQDGDEVYVPAGKKTGPLAPPK